MFGQVMCQVRSHTTGNRAPRAGESTDLSGKRAPSAGGEAGQATHPLVQVTPSVSAGRETVKTGAPDKSKIRRGVALFPCPATCPIVKNRTSEQRLVRGTPTEKSPARFSLFPLGDPGGAGGGVWAERRGPDGPAAFSRGRPRRSRPSPRKPIPHELSPDGATEDPAGVSPPPRRGSQV